jgi:hypothetical protein
VEALRKESGILQFTETENIILSDLGRHKPFFEGTTKLAVIANMKHRRLTQTTISTCLKNLWNLGRPL